MEKRAVPSVAGLGVCAVFLVSGCADKPAQPPPQDTPPLIKIYLVPSGKYLIGDEVWIACSSQVNTANAKVMFRYNRSDDPPSLLWEELAVAAADGPDVKVALPSWTVTKPSLGYSQLRVLDRSDTANKNFLIDSLVLSRILLTSPKDGDSVTVGTPVPITWKTKGSDISVVNIWLWVDGNRNDLLADRGSSVPADSLWSWTPGGEPFPVTYTGSEDCRIQIGDYARVDENQDINSRPLVVRP